MRALFPLEDVKPQWPTEQKVGFARDKLSGRLPFLPQKLRLLAFDPSHPREDGEPYRVGAHILRRGDTDAAIRGVAADVKVLDPLAYDLDTNTADFGDLSIHFGVSGPRRAAPLSLGHPALAHGSARPFVLASCYRAIRMELYL